MNEDFKVYKIGVWDKLVPEMIKTHYGNKIIE